jgi:hypothetical protein
MMTCLCHFPDGSDGVYHVEQERLLRGALTTLTGIEGVWVITEMVAPDESEAIDAELWLREAADEELTPISGSDPKSP